MELLAIIWLVCFAVQVLTPGSMYLQKPKIDYENPKIYINMVMFFISLTIMLLISF